MSDSVIQPLRREYAAHLLLLDPSPREEPCSPLARVGEPAEDHVAVGLRREPVRAYGEAGACPRAGLVANGDLIELDAVASAHLSFTGARRELEAAVGRKSEGERPREFGAASLLGR